MGKKKRRPKSRPRRWRPPGTPQLAPVVLWCLFFAALRLFSHGLAPAQGSSSVQIALSGAHSDLVAYVLVAAIILLSRRYLPKLARLGEVILLLIIAAGAFANALFVSWSHFPLDFSYLGYMDSLPSLWFSAESLLTPTAPSLIWGSCALAILALGLGARSTCNRWLVSNRRLRLGATACLGLATAISLSQRLLQAHSSHHRSLAANYLSHALGKMLPSGAQSNDGMPVPQMRQTLITDQGHYRFADPRYPLVKTNSDYGSRRPDLAALPALPPKPNLVLIFMESFRAANIGAYHASQSRLTPRFDALAKDGWLWENFYANGVQTARAATASLASLYPPLGEAIAKRNPRLPLRGLGEIMGENGYRNEYYHNGSLRFANKTPFFANLGYQLIVGGRDMVADFESARHGWGVPDHILFAQIAARLNQAQGEKPLFLTAFTVSTHHPWQVPLAHLKVVPEDGGEYPAYQNCIRYADHSLGVLFDRLEPQVLSNTIFVITADTAQPMGQHDNNFALLKYLYEGNVRIPLLIYAPQLLGKAQRWAEVGSQVDLAPTLLDLLGLPSTNHFIGRSLLSAPPPDPYAFFSSPYTGGWIGLRQGDYKYFFHQESQRHYLFALNSDPQERHNLASDRQQLVAEFAAKSRRLARATGQAYRAPLWPETKR